MFWKVRPKPVSAFVLRQLGCARQPMTGRRDARLLAGRIFPSANILERQQDFVSVSKYYLSSANMNNISCFSVSNKYLLSAIIICCQLFNYHFSVSNYYLASAIISSRRHNQFRASLNRNGYKFSSGRLAFFFCHDLELCGLPDLPVCFVEKGELEYSLCPILESYSRRHTLIVDTTVCILYCIPEYRRHLQILPPH